ncbi:cytochrome P450 [Lasiosphaeris hirsuta]|uniref:Cytochrome P450 n=1 Tax=Lasiosphaeris hirsuta TaxID=260670 RepID=A0AA39ZVI8_9PEZI|nr:cytochrome P450 [Lasiosphaeris hirsuta]
MAVFASLLPVLALPSWVAVGIAVLLVYKFVIYPSFLSPLARIPAARWHARFLPFYSLYLKYTGTESRTTLKLHQRYGPVVRLGPNELTVNCYEGGIKTIYGGGFPKTDWYQNGFANYETENVFTVKGKEHGQIKRVFSHTLANSTILSSSSIRARAWRAIFDQLCPILRQSCKSRTPIDIHPLNYAYAMDTYTSFQLGDELATDFLTDADTREWYLNHSKTLLATQNFFWATEVPNLTNWLFKLGFQPIPFDAIESKLALEDFFIKKYDRAAQVLNGEETHSQDTSKRPTLFALAHARFGNIYKDSESPGRQPYPHRLQIASNLYDQSLAATENNGIALTYVHYELARRPEVQSALRTELLAAEPDLITADNTFGDPKAIESLRLLDAIVTETLRIHPPAGAALPRTTPGPGTSTIGGFEGIPPGVRVEARAWALHRNPDVFPEPEEWRPERWLGATPGQLTEMKRWFWAFGSGPRMCTGNHFAMLSIKLAIAAIYLHFSTSVVDAEGVDMEQEDAVVSRPKGDKLMLQFHEI